MKPGCVLITGAGGFVGRALVDGFSGRGWKVIGLDREPVPNEPDPESRPPGVRHVVADLTAGFPSELPRADLVVHAAWITADPAASGVTDAEYIEVNLGPVRAALEYAARTQPTAFVFLSSTGVFAAGDAVDGLTDADRPTGASAYARTKRRAESLVLEGLGEASSGHVLRLGYLYGPGEAVSESRPGVSAVASWVDAARRGEALEVRADDPAREWTYTGDLAAAVEAVAGSPATGRPVHLGSAHVWTDSRLAGFIVSRLGGDVTMVPAGLPMKPPMVPSRIPALDDFVWTSPEDGIEALLTAEAA